MLLRNSKSYLLKLLFILALLAGVGYSKAQYCPLVGTNCANYFESIKISNLDFTSLQTQCYSDGGNSYYPFDTIYLNPDNPASVSTITPIYWDSKVTVFLDSDFSGNYDITERQELVPAGLLLGNKGTIIVDPTFTGDTVTRIRFVAHLASDVIDPCSGGTFLASVYQAIDFPVRISRNPPPTGYCPSQSDCGFASISNVSVTGDNGSAINNTSVSCTGYSDYTNLRVNMSPGNPYTISVETVSPLATTALGNIYIDWNEDRYFDENSEAYPGVQLLASQGWEYALTVPANVSSGLKRMRVTSSNFTDIGAGTLGPRPCGTRTDAGETEDYTIFVTALLDTIPYCVDPAKVYPANGAGNVCQNTTFKWNKAEFATAYHFSLFQGSTAVISNFSTTDTSYNIPNLLPGKTYRWVVVPYNPNKSAIGCDTLTFYTKLTGDPSASISPGGPIQICQNATVNLFGGPTGGQSPYRHSWDGVKNAYLSDTSKVNPVFKSNEAGLYTYIYTVYDNYSCYGKDTVSIEVAPAASNGTVSIDQDTICSGSSTKLITSGSKGGITWETSTAAGGPWTSVSLTQINDTTWSTGNLLTGTYFRPTATLGTCIDRDTVVHCSVIAVPTKPIVMVDDTVLCPGEIAHLWLTNYGSPTTIRWNGGTAVDTLSTSSAGWYLATVTVNGCSSSSDSVRINVYDSPVRPKITRIGSEPSCSADLVVLKSSYVGNNSWNTGETTDSIIINSSGNYWVVYTNSHGCAASSDTIKQTINPSPVKPVISFTSASPLCEGDSVQLNSSLLGGNRWSSGSTLDQITIKQSGSFYVTNSIGSCSITSDTVTINFENRPVKPVISLTTTGPLCEGLIAELRSNSAVGNNWSTSETTESINVTTDGIYTLYIVASSGCTSDTDHFTVDFEEVPAKPVINQSGNQLTVSGSADHYQWFDASGPISGATSATYKPNHSGFYYVIAYSLGGCESASSDSLNFAGTGVIEAQVESDLEIFPNPTSDRFTLTGYSENNTEAQIIDASGRSVLKVILSKGRSSIIDIHLSPGIYFISLMNSNSSKGWKKLIIE